jgi:hypothetical protein
MKFKSLSELTRELNALISDEEFKLTLEELENVNQLAREISERLIVLRHKAYEKFLKPEDANNLGANNILHQESIENIESEANTETESEIATPFFQMSLIDAIEEAAAVVEENQKVEIESTNSEVKLEEIHHIKNEQICSNNEEVSNVIVSKENEVMDEKSEEPIHSFNPSPIPPASQPISLADKHQFDKIDDLKRAITLNQRFQFSRELFKGNNQEYEVAIDRLNNSTREEAFLMLRDLRAKFDWQEESAAALDFYGLVERRYSSL